LFNVSYRQLNFSYIAHVARQVRTWVNIDNISSCTKKTISTWNNSSRNLLIKKTNPPINQNYTTPPELPDDMLSLRIFKDLFWHFDRVLRQYEVTKGVKSRNSRSAENWQSWRDFLWCATILWPEWRFGSAIEIVVRFYVAWRDFTEGSGRILGFQRNRGAILFGVARFFTQKIFPI